MSNIIAFRAVAGPKRNSAAPPGASAELLFFTGVRYERQTANAHAEAQPQRRAKQTAKVQAKNGGKTPPRKDGRKRRA
jgi:hypothetical protein